MMAGFIRLSLQTGAGRVSYCSWLISRGNSLSKEFSQAERFSDDCSRSRSGNMHRLYFRMEVR